MNNSKSLRLRSVLLCSLLLGSSALGHAQQTASNRVVVVPGAFADSLRVAPQETAPSLMARLEQSGANEASWRYVEGVQLLPNEEHETFAAPDSAFYFFDSSSDILRFAKTVTPQQWEQFVRKGDSITMEQMNADQKALLQSLFQKYQATLRTPDNRSLVEVSQSIPDQKDISVQMVLQLYFQFNAKALDKGWASDMMVEVIDRWHGAKPFTPFISKEEADKLGASLQKVASSKESKTLAVAPVFTDVDSQKRVPLSTLFAAANAGETPAPQGSPLVTKTLEQWVEGASKSSHTPLAVDESLKGRMVAVAVSPASETPLGSFLTALGLAADDAARWKRNGEGYVLSLPGAHIRQRQQLIQDSEQLYFSTVDYYYGQLPAEAEKTHLPKELFLAPEQSIVSFPAEVQGLIRAIINRMPDGPNKQYLLDPANSTKVTLNFNAMPQLLFYYKEQKSPHSRSWGHIESSIHASALRPSTHGND